MIACDERTDATDTMQVLIFLRGVDDNFCCTEELLDMMSLKGTTTGRDIIEAVSEAVEKMGLKWDKLCGVTTDGALAMTGERKRMASRVCAKVKESGGETVRMHCIIHQEAQLQSFNAAHFPALSEIKSAFPKADLSAKKEKYVSVIASLVTEFNQRFQDFSVTEKQVKLFSTPFLVDAEEVEESLQLELIEMQCDDSLKSQHQLLSLPDLYQSLDNEQTFSFLKSEQKRTENQND